MKAPPASLLPALQLAADLRVGGASWDTVAIQLKRKADTCRRWPAAYPETWREALRRAREQFARDTDGEARVVLRMLLRSETEKTSLAAAQTILKGQPKSRPRPRRADDGLAAYVAKVREVSDADLEAMLDDALAARPAGGAADGTPPATGPNLPE